MADTEVTTPPATEAEAPATTEEVKAKAAPKRKKGKRNVPAGQLHIQATFNNTIITFTDNSGNVLTSASAGACGFRGSRRARHMRRKLLPSERQLQSSSNMA